MTSQPDGKTKRADATRAALIQAAERLIAQKGLAQVSTREILQAAGQRNQSALQYHFGSKAGLMRATISERTREIDIRRQELIAEWDGTPTLAQVLEAQILPLAELAETTESGRNYILFLCQAIVQPDWDLRRAIKDFEIVGLAITYEHFDAMLSHMPDAERLMRQEATYDMAVTALKRWCLSKSPKMSPQQITNLVVKAGEAILSA